MKGSTCDRRQQHEILILDNIGYVQQSPEEVEVLFTLFYERYERATGGACVAG